MKLSNSILSKNLILLLIFSTVGAQGEIVFSLVESDQSNIERQIVGIGDQNSDGYNDILLGSTDHHAALIFLGGNPVDTIPDFVIPVETEDVYSGRWVSRLGDINGDGILDFSVIVRDTLATSPDQAHILNKGLNAIYLGGWPPIQVDRVFEAPLVSAGDINYDGYDDFISSWYINRAGHNPYIHLFYGGDYSEYHAGDSVVFADYRTVIFQSQSSGQDITGDGVDDLVISTNLVVGEPYFTLFLYRGGLDFSMENAESYLSNNYLNAFIGDMNADGVSEWVMRFNTTRPVLFKGNESVVSMPIGAIPALAEESELATHRIGDFNNDGHSDLLITDAFGLGGAGLCAIYLGGNHADLQPDRVISGWDSGWQKLGTQVSWCGDVDGDGCDDLLVGAEVRNDGSLNEKIVLVIPGDSLLSTDFVPWFDNWFPNTDTTLYSNGQEIEFNIQFNDIGPGRRYVNWYVDDELAQSSNGLEITLDTLSFFPYSYGYTHDDTLTVKVKIRDSYHSFFLADWEYTNSDNLNWVVVIDTSTASINSQRLDPNLNNLHAFPNPFNNSIQIEMNREPGMQISELQIYDLRGRLIRTISLNDSPNSNTIRTIWNGDNQKGKLLGTGVYFVTARLMNSEISTLVVDKVLLLR